MSELDNNQDEINGLNQTPFINRSKVKSFALDFAHSQQRTKNHTRVSGEFLKRINDRVRGIIIAEVKDQATKGKTLM
jgi:hypothetical protein